MTFTLNTLLFILFAFALPPVSDYLCRKFRIFAYLGPVVLCYILGMLLLNSGLLRPEDEMRGILTSASVPLAIGLMLLTGDLLSWFRTSAKGVLSFSFEVLSTVTFAVLGFYLFHNYVQDGAYYAGMFSAVYTGGSANMAAVSTAIDAPDNTYALAMMYDVVLGGLFLVFTMGFAPHFYKKILKPHPDAGKAQQTEAEASKRPFSWKEFGLGFLLVAAATGIGAGLALLITGKMDAGVIIMVLTAICAGFSLSPKVRSLKSTYPAGEYFLLVFASVMGLSSDFSLFRADSLYVLGFMAFVMFGSMAMHLLLSFLFRIDKDTHIITSTAGIMSPPFIPGVVKALGNHSVLLTGLTAGIVGNVLGTYLGIIVYQWLS